ncbi:MAG: flagellar assembly protein FliW [Azoarcus sp.]|jgi:flagellar assembly factor FliW|nr:flagellar assembly protein FliW [Azoarcus sp.]
MKIESPVLGAVEISDDKVIEFPQGLPGFEQLRRFVFIHEEGGESGVFLLQSVDDANIAFSVTGPERLGITYELPLSDAEVAVLELSRPEDAVAAVIVRKDDDKDDKVPANAGLRANFMAPLLINIGARRGLQKIIDKAGYDIILRVRG